MRLPLSLFVLLVPTLAHADDGVVATTAAPPPASYPLRRIDRPRTLPEDMVQASFALSADKTGALTSRMDVFYTPIDKLEARVSYAPQLTDGRDFEKPVVLSLRHNTFKYPSHLFVATQVDVPLATRGNTLTKLNLGLPTKLKLDRTFALYFGDRLVKADFTNNLVVVLDAPLDLGMQLEDHVFLQLGTTLVSMPFYKPSALMTKTTTIADVTPVLATTYFSPTSTLDVGAQLGVTDAQHATRSLLVALSVALRR